MRTGTLLGLYAAGVSASVVCKTGAVEKLGGATVIGAANSVCGAHLKDAEFHQEKGQDGVVLSITPADAESSPFSAEKCADRFAEILKQCSGVSGGTIEADGRLYEIYVDSSVSHEKRGSKGGKGGGKNTKTQAQAQPTKTEAAPTKPSATEKPSSSSKASSSSKVETTSKPASSASKPASSASKPTSSASKPASSASTSASPSSKASSSNASSSAASGSATTKAPSGSATGTASGSATKSGASSSAAGSGTASITSAPSSATSKASSASSSGITSSSSASITSSASRNSTASATSSSAAPTSTDANSCAYTPGRGKISARSPCQEDEWSKIEAQALEDTSDLVYSCKAKGPKGRSIEALEALEALTRVQKRSGDQFAQMWDKWEEVLKKLDENFGKALGDKAGKEQVTIIWAGGISGVRLGSRGKKGKTGDIDFAYHTGTSDELRALFKTAIEQTQKDFPTVLNQKKLPISNSLELFATPEKIQTWSTKADQNNGPAAFEGKNFKAIDGDWLIQVYGKMSRMDQMRRKLSPQDKKANRKYGQHKPRDADDAKAFFKQWKAGHSGDLKLSDLLEIGKIWGKNQAEVENMVRSTMDLVVPDLNGVDATLKKLAEEGRC